jgi:hypothetical protein
MSQPAQGVNRKMSGLITYFGDDKRGEGRGLADMAKTKKNAAAMALEAGNSPAMIFSNYREPVTPQDAKVWFSLRP